MEQLLDQIRAALVPDASDDTRAAGATACRTILAALDAKTGEPMQAPAGPAAPLVAMTPPAPYAPPSESPRPSPIATVQALVAALRGMPPDQLLDLAITRLRAAVPDGAAVAPVPPLRFNLIPLGSGITGGER